MHSAPNPTTNTNHCDICGEGVREGEGAEVVRTDRAAEHPAVDWHLFVHAECYLAQQDTYELA